MPENHPIVDRRGFLKGSGAVLAVAGLGGVDLVIRHPRTAPRPLSPTFGPRETFLGLNERYYGAVDIDAGAGTMTVDLKVESGELRHREVIAAE